MFDQYWLHSDVGTTEAYAYAERHIDNQDADRLRSAVHPPIYRTGRGFQGADANLPSGLRWPDL